MAGAVGASLLLVWNIRHGIGVVRKTPEQKPKARKRLPRLRYEGVDAGQLVPGMTETGVPLAGVPPAVAFLAMEWMDG